MTIQASCLSLAHLLLVIAGLGSAIPIVVNTWNFVDATNAGWDTLTSSGSALDAVVAGCSHCEENRCDGTVGWGGSPDENGETTLDAMVMFGPTHDVGAVAGLRRVKNAVSVARHVLERTSHSILVGDHATEFALEMGFDEENLTSEASLERWQQWLQNDCQPNYWQNVEPDPSQNCGPYSPTDNVTDSMSSSNAGLISEHNHDTIGMVAINDAGDIAVGTSTNGLNHKVPGRVGDTAIVGAGGYVDNDIGAAVATGDGDVLVRFLPCVRTVEYMRLGLGPRDAAQAVFDHMLSVYPDMNGAVVAVSANGTHGAACSFSSFTYSVRTSDLSDADVISVTC